MHALVERFVCQVGGNKLLRAEVGGGSTRGVLLLVAWPTAVTRRWFQVPWEPTGRRFSFPYLGTIRPGNYEGQ